MAETAHKQPDMQHKACGLVLKASGTPDDAQMALINRHALVPLEADQVYVRSVYLAHNGIDRDREVFDEALLDDFAKTLPGKGMFVIHPSSYKGDGGPGEGIWFAAKTETMSLDQARAVLKEPDLQWAPSTTEAKLLVASYYMLAMDDDPENKRLRAKTDAGIAGHFSIGFAAADMAPVLNDMGDRIAMRWVGPGEAREGSLVWLGAQPGARAYKGANRDTDTGRTAGDTKTTEENTMADETTKQALLDEQAKNAGLQKQVDNLTPKATAYDALEGLLGKDLLADPEGIKLAVQDGQAHRAELVDDIVTHQRTLKMIDADSAEAVKKEKALYADWPLEKIKTTRERLVAMLPDGQIKGSDTATGKDTDDDGKGGKKGLRDASATKQSMGQTEK